MKPYMKPANADAQSLTSEMMRNCSTADTVMLSSVRMGMPTSTNSTSVTNSAITTCGGRRHMLLLLTCCLFGCRV